MRFEAEISDLADAVQFAASVVARRSTSPIMETVRINASDNSIAVSGTDHDIHTRARCDGAVTDAGSICVHANDLLQLLKNLTSGTVQCTSLTGDAPTLIVEAGRTKVEIPTLDPSLFPAVEKPDAESEVAGGAKAFLMCAPFANADDTRTALQGVAFTSGMAVGTDGYMFFACPCESPESKVVPVAAVPAIKRLSEGRFFLSDRTWRIETQNASAIGRLIDAEPIDVNRLISGYGDPFASIDADGLLHALKTVTFGRAKTVYFEALEDAYRVQGDGFEGRHISGGAIVTAEGSPHSMVLATKYMLPVLSALAGRVLGISTNGQGVRFGSDGTFALVMPMRDRRHKLDEVPA